MLPTGPFTFSKNCVMYSSRQSARNAIYRSFGRQNQIARIRGAQAARARSQARATALAMARTRYAGSANLRSGGFLQKEKKFYDTELNNSTVTSSWGTADPIALNCISAPAQGDGESDRDGRVFYINSVHIHGYCRITATEGNTAPTSNDLFRVVLVLDKQTNAAQLTATDVMDAGGTSDVIAFRNLQYTQRFRILKDVTFTMQPQCVNEGASNLFSNTDQYQYFSMNHIFKKPLKVQCSGTSAGVSSIVDNSLHVIACATANQITTLYYQARIRFCD